MIRKLINEGELQSFRIGVLIRISAAEVERYEKCPAEPTSPIPSNDSGEVSPSSGGSSPRMTQKRNRKGTVVNSPRKIGRAPKRRPALSGKGPTLVHAPGGGARRETTPQAREHNGDRTREWE